LRRQNLYEAWRELIEFVGVVDMPVQGHAVELGEHVDTSNAWVQTVADRDINQPVFPSEVHGGLSPLFCQWEEPRAGSSAHDDCQSTIDRQGQGNVSHKGFAS
jgi:hypothetical protein